MPVSVVKPGGQPSAWVSEEHQIMASDVIKEDGIYQDTRGNRFQYRKDHVLGPGELAQLTRVGDYPGASVPGAAELAATQPTADEKAAKAAAAKADADAQADADAKAQAEAEAAKAAPAVENKQAPKPENKSQ